MTTTKHDPNQLVLPLTADAAPAPVDALILDMLRELRRPSPLCWPDTTASVLGVDAILSLAAEPLSLAAEAMKFMYGPCRLHLPHRAPAQLAQVWASASYDLPACAACRFRFAQDICRLERSLGEVLREICRLLTLATPPTRQQLREARRLERATRNGAASNHTDVTVVALVHGG